MMINIIQQVMLLCLLLFVVFCGQADATSQELDIVNRPVNLQGLTGLIVTTTPFTMPRGALEIAFSATSETSAVPDITVSEFLGSLTIGITRPWKYAPGVVSHTGIGLDPNKKRGMGDTGLLYKWNIIPPGEKAYIPAAAVFVAVQGLNGDRDNGFQRFHNWGAKIGLSLGREINFEEHIIGVYFDGQLVGKTSTGTTTGIVIACSMLECCCPSAKDRISSWSLSTVLLRESYTRILMARIRQR
jgi:hypothetical protein